ncbi:heavy metal translocating P-type ATPase [Candidatus Parcubacteria bacterium]|nr:MAG: heavy metal translocating P-type ATPase [Candidatus Parcubacteria bacterium]
MNNKHNNNDKDMKENKKEYYTCPMHPEIKADKPGKCPKCGGMDLILRKEGGHPGDKSAHMLHEVETGHNHAHVEEDYYTCPMHPEIMQDKRGKCPKCGGMELVKKSGLDSGHVEHDHAGMMASPEAAADFLRRFFIVTALLIPLAFFSEPAVKFLGTPDFALRPFVEFGIATVIFYFGFVFFQHARHEIMMRQYGMMTLVSLGVGAGYLFSAASTFIPAIQAEFYLEISSLIWVLLFGHYLEAKSSTAAGDALQEVAKLLPKEAHLKIGGTVKDVEILSLKVGDVVIVKPGEKIPADGKIIKGSGNFNEAHLTGESKPVEKGVGAEVPAGAISIDGSVEVELLRVGESSTIGQIQSLIASAKQTKPSVQKLADRASKWLTFSALAVSFTALIVWSVIVGQPFIFAATLAITVLVIACPHALGLAIPTVSTIATRLAVKNGVFIKDMSKIEIIKNVDYVVFDKTGTLTRGEFGITGIKTFTGSAADLLKIAGAIESHSSHVIGMAIVDYLKKKGIKISEAVNVKNLSGRGMEAKVSGKNYFVGNKRLMEEKDVWTKEAENALLELSNESKTPVFVGGKNGIIGVIALSDEIKEESRQAVQELHKLGVKVAMLTGDTKAAAAPIARELGIDMVFAEVLPEDKYKHIRKLQNEGNIVLMAGDGVNDAPALTQANAGVAIGAGTDVAVEAGDVVLTQSNPQHLVRLIVLSKIVYRKMLENLFWAVGYNVLAIPAAAGLFIPLGFKLTPAAGALLMSLSSVIVVINAMTLRKAKLEVQ